MSRPTAIGSALVEIGRKLRVQRECLKMAYHRLCHSRSSTAQGGSDQTSETCLEQFWRQMHRKGIEDECGIGGAVGNAVHTSVSSQGQRGPFGLGHIRLAVGLEWGVCTDSELAG